MESNYHYFWISVLSAKSPCSTVIYKLKSLGGNPPYKSKLLTPLTVEMWLWISYTLVSRLASTGTLCPFNNLTWIVVTGLFLFGYKKKFSIGPFFLANLVWGFLVSPPSEVPVPEKAI